MASPTPLKRKRSGDDLITTELRSGTSPVELATNPDSNLLLLKDKIIN
jgi:hypothetical protein